MEPNDTAKMESSKSMMDVIAFSGRNANVHKLAIVQTDRVMVAVVYNVFMESGQNQNCAKAKMTTVSVTI
jgi:hypothetical protein